jgi:hypothetical protein
MIRDKQPGDDRMREVEELNQVFCGDLVMKMMMRREL